MINGLAERLILSRKKMGLSRKQVSEIIGVSESLIGLYESGTRQPSLHALIKLSSLYKVTTDYLLGCEPKSGNAVSLSGLTEEQLKAVDLIIQCFHKSVDIT